MRFKEFMSVDESWLSKLFNLEPVQSQGPKMLALGDKKTPATSYGCNARRTANAKKWNQIRSEGDAERLEKQARRGS